MRHFLPQSSPTRTAPVVKRKVSNHSTGTESRVFFIIKKEVPQMKAAKNKSGLASLRIRTGSMFDQLLCSFKGGPPAARPGCADCAGRESVI